MVINLGWAVQNGSNLTDSEQNGSGQNSPNPGNPMPPANCDDPSTYPTAQPYPHLDPNTYYESWVYFGQKITKQSFQSEVMGIAYTYHVYLPPEYELEPNKKFQVLFRLDGQRGFDFYSRTIDVEARPLVLVAIEDGDRRATDYLYPGAEPYYTFCEFKLDLSKE
ncbi:MAG: hypothetical protein ACI9Y1_003714 [Lentisphaeria bacterium]